MYTATANINTKVVVSCDGPPIVVVVYKGAGTGLSIMPVAHGNIKTEFVPSLIPRLPATHSTKNGGNLVSLVGTAVPNSFLLSQWWLTRALEKAEPI